MTLKPTLVAQASLICLASWLAQPTAARAQGLGAQGLASIVPGERLSDWILRNTGPNADMTALHWRVSAERAPQARLREAVVQGLRPRADSPTPASSNRDFSALSDWLLTLPLTGRLTVAIADARWLQSAPSQDPILQDGHSVVAYARPRTVMVLTETGRPCAAAHVSGALIQDYLRACLGAQASQQVDQAWIAQADGRTRQLGIAPWNQAPQDEPGPGAWVWAPSRQADISLSVSDNLIRFFATQAPADFAQPLTPIQPVMAPPAQRVLPRDAQLTASDWGEIGLLQTPTARMAPAGGVRLHMSRVEPYTRGTFMFQPLDWLEAGFRYTDIGNRLYGASIAGDQTLKDKSIDFKIRLLEESNALPQLAVGVRDFGGTGLFSGEYLVANKRWGNWDASLGLGWGYLGGRGNLKNPLNILGDRFETRPGNSTATGGTANFQSMFRGPTALFGGLQWHSPYDPLVLKLELDGNDYQHEADANNQPVKSPFNFGATYRYSPNVDFSLAFERGNRLMLGFTLHGGLNQLYSPKLLDPVLPPVKADAPTQLPAAGWGGTAQGIELYTGWSVRSISHQHATTTIDAETTTAIHLQERIERAIAVLHRDAPASSTRFVLTLQERGLPLSQVQIDRAEWVLQNTRTQPPALRLNAQETFPAQTAYSHAAALTPVDSLAGAWKAKPRGFSAEVGPSYNQILGGPDGFLLYQLGVQGVMEQRFSDSTWLSSVVNLRLLDNYDRFGFDGASKLPRVRTDQRQYVTTSALTLPLLQLTHVRDLGQGHYASAYVGMLESMYGGVGGEWLYRPWQSHLAFGLDVNAVRQRDFRQNLSFRDYGVGTGHATLYWDTGWKDLQVNLSAGRYLAGDVGATLDVKRVFSNGVALGAWATKTNVSAQDFGEGSFDKGIYVNIPFDVMLPKSTAGSGTIAWSPLSRDGGARLTRRFALYDLTRQRDPRALQWRQTKPGVVSSAENTSYVLSEPAPGTLDTLGSSTTTLGRQIAGIPAATWLWAGGAVLASSLLDKKADNWASGHQTGQADRLGRVSNALPLGLALGAGLLYTGIGGQPAASTAETALKAAAYTWGANALTRYVVGRARPTEGLGSASFNGLKSGAAQSGFASNHVALAFALATPFAQQHDMPWLYAAAAASSFGRVQKREHWVSDTVAGAFMGYAIGSLMTDQQRNTQKGMQLSVTPQSVTANWVFK